MKNCVNTVSPVNQLRGNPNITFEGRADGSPRIMFVGNSITRHAPLEKIGWTNDFGMAASSKENDYVHLTEAFVREKHPDAAFCICQASGWEVGYAREDHTNDSFVTAREFGADYIIFRIIENVSVKDFDHAEFTEAVREFISYLNPGSRAKVIMTTGFWSHPGDEDLRRIAEEDGYPLAELGDIGRDETMRATGLFAHEGVASHPGDKGMAAIAEAVEKYLDI